MTVEIRKNNLLSDLHRLTDTPISAIRQRALGRGRSVAYFTRGYSAMWKAPVTQSWVSPASRDSLKQLLCPGVDLVDADMHDGDQREVCDPDTSLTLQPSANVHTWSVQAVIDTTFCNASVDFNVPGKHNTPPLSLTDTILLTNSFGPGNCTALKRIVEFTDPSGTTGATSFPLDQWVPVAAQEVATVSLKKGLAREATPHRLDVCLESRHDRQKSSISRLKGDIEQHRA